MIQIDQVLVSEDIFDRAFVCDLKSCKGACCVNGTGGAPLEEEELSILQDIYPTIKPTLRAEAIEVIEKEGLFVKSTDGSYETNLVNGRECVFVTFTEKGVAQCAIEKAQKQGLIGWEKPISCHLYPIRISKIYHKLSLNYHRWSICEAACALGKSLKVPLYQFIKKGLVRKFGIDFFEKLVKYSENREK